MLKLNRTTLFFFLLILDKAAKKDELFSVCLPTNHRSKWTQQNIDYFVNGPFLKEKHSYENCYDEVIKRFGDNYHNKLNAPSEIQNKDIYAFSFFFDRLSSAKIFNSTYHSKNIKTF